MLKAASGEEGGLFGSSDGSIGYPGNSGMYTRVTSYGCCSERTEYDECILKLYLSLADELINKKLDVFPLFLTCPRSNSTRHGNVFIPTRVRRVEPHHAHGTK